MEKIMISIIMVLALENNNILGESIEEKEIINMK